jgi:hypothetical protein
MYETERTTWNSCKEITFLITLKDQNGRIFIDAELDIGTMKKVLKKLDEEQLAAYPSFHYSCA